MAQGKLKVKSKVPDSVAKKKKQQQSSAKNSGKVVKKGKKNPINPKAQAAQLTAKFKKDLGKKINASIESELTARCSRAEEGKSFLTIGSELGKKK